MRCWRAVITPQRSHAHLGLCRLRDRQGGRADHPRRPDAHGLIDKHDTRPTRPRNSVAGPGKWLCHNECLLLLLDLGQQRLVIGEDRVGDALQIGTVCGHDMIPKSRAAVVALQRDVENLPSTIIDTG